MKAIFPYLRRPLMWVGIATIYILPLLTLNGAVDMFLKLDTIEGESKDKTHGKEIDVLAWSWGASVPITRTAKTADVGSGIAQDLSVTKYVDKASPKLLISAVTGKHIGDGTLVVRKAGESPVEYIKITMTDILVSSISTGGSGGEDNLTETVSFNFSKVKFEYTPVVDGKTETPISETWDIYN